MNAGCLSRRAADAVPVQGGEGLLVMGRETFISLIASHDLPQIFNLINSSFIL